VIVRAVKIRFGGALRVTCLVTQHVRINNVVQQLGIA
jgi:hypothetical protein